MENMNKAKFIRKYYGRGYDRDSVYLVYEYRGHEYTVYENMAKGNVPLAWQHRDEQAHIDNLIEEQSRPKSRIDMKIQRNTHLIYFLRHWQQVTIRF